MGERATVAWVLAALLGASIEPVLVKLGYRAEATPYPFRTGPSLRFAVRSASQPNALAPSRRHSARPVEV